MSVPHRLPAFVLPILAVLALAVLPLCGQQPGQNWPPDDDFTGVQPQPIPSYSSTGQYGSSQPQSPPGSQQQAWANVSQSPAQQSYAQQPLSPDQLSQLIAPIALYPDALIAQILAASTYPAQVAAADQWLQSMGNASPDQIAAGADAQTTWDPSVKALTAFPKVLSMLDRNLQWTTSLGNAYYNQPQDVLQTIQVMRQRAQDAGNLQSTPQVDVQQNQGYIDIAPANPQVVYVPTYDPWSVYGQPVDPYPGYSWIDAGPYFAPVQYDLGFAISAFFGSPWGWYGWGLDWFSYSVLFNHNDYCTRSHSVRDWGFPYGGPRAYPGYPHSIHGNYAWGHNGHNNWGRNGYNHGGYGSAGNGPNRNYPRGGGAPVKHWGDARTNEGFNRGFPQRNQIYGRPSSPTQQAFGGRSQQFGNRQQFAGREQYNRQPYNSGASAFPRDNHIGRPGMSFSGPSNSYRAPQYNDPRGNGFNGNRAYNGYNGFNQSNSYGRPQAWRQPQQPFGGFNNRSPQTYSYNGGGHSSWGNSGRNSGGSFGGRSFSGGGNHSFSGGGHSFSGGGGHSFGGGHSAGGGHSSGGGHSFGGGGGSHGGGGHR